MMYRCHGVIIKSKQTAHGVHGQIALNEGTEEDARRAVVHFEDKLLQVNTVSIANYDYLGI
jgi:hypothetical protein